MWARQLVTGTILVVPLTRDGAAVAADGRVSFADQPADLDRQVARLAQDAAAAGLAPSRVVTVVGSALSGNRPRLGRLLADPGVATVVVEHRDRLARWGVESIEAAMWLMQRSGRGLGVAAHGRRIVVVDGGEVDDDLAGVMVEVGTCMCARLSGRGSARGRAQRAVGAGGQACT